MRIVQKLLLLIPTFTIAFGLSTASADTASSLLPRYSQISAGLNGVCGLVTDGTVNCWGTNQSGAVPSGGFTGTDSQKSTAFQTVIPGLTNVSQVSTGLDFSCFLISGGTIKCMGKNDYGQLGNGTTTNSITPVSVSGITNAIQVSAGGAFVCAVLATGSVMCWGSDFYGTLGDGVQFNDSRNGATGAKSSVPKSVTGITNAIQVSAGDNANAEESACAVLTTGSVMCWGSGYLGNGTTDHSSVPVIAVSSNNAKNVAVGGNHTCVLLNDASVMCWGLYAYDGSNYSGAWSPTSINGATGIMQLVSGYDHSCAVTLATLECWGRNSNGQFGVGNGTSSATPVVNSSLSSVKSVSAGGMFTCALLSTGLVSCWGNNQNFASSGVVFTGATGSSTSFTLSPPTLPSAPTSVGASIQQNPSVGQVKLFWSSPTSTGNSAILYYVASGGGQSCTVSGATFCRFSGLTNNTPVNFSVIAINAVGASPPSEVSNSVIPSVPPSAPANIVAVAGDGSATVSWTAASTNGGVAIDAYEASVPNSNWTGCTASPTSTSCTVTGLKNGTSYVFEVVAINTSGLRTTSSVPSSAVTPQPPKPPGAPSNASVSYSNGQATVKWQVPISDGGAPITGYTATSLPSGFSCQSSASTCVVSGLSLGTTYTFQVSAQNSAGQGQKSLPSNSILADAPPSPPTNLTITMSSGSATISWQPPQTDNGSPISSYIITDASNTVKCTTSTLICTIKGLTNGTRYVFTIAAVNAAGTGSSLNSSIAGIPLAQTVVTTTTVKKPVLLTITCIKGKLTKKVTAVKPICPAGYKRK